MSRITIKFANKIFDKNFYALKDLNMEIESGEFMVIVGPSGCGKTTLLRVIAGLEKLNSGQIYIDNKNVTNLTPKCRNISMVFQNYALYPHMTVFQNIAFSLNSLTRDKIREKVYNVAEMLDITNLLHKKPTKLSGGQCQRVSLARAMVRNPKIFLMDEPLSSLDAQIRVKTRQNLIKIYNGDRNFLFRLTPVTNPISS